MKTEGQTDTQKVNLESLRKKVVNPYTIANMQLAVDSLEIKLADGTFKRTAEGKGKKDKPKKVKPNVLYVKFSPSTFEEESLLRGCYETT